jgi:hypothetical protein
MWLSLLSVSGVAATIKCNDFAKAEVEMKKEMKSEIENLNKVRKQIDSTKNTINDFNKNCQNASSSKCNPAMYSMMTSQMPLLSGQESNLEAKIVNLKIKSEETHDKWTACKQAMAIRK